MAEIDKREDPNLFGVAISDRTQGPYNPDGLTGNSIEVPLPYTLKNDRDNAIAARDRDKEIAIEQAMQSGGETEVKWEDDLRGGKGLEFGNVVKPEHDTYRAYKAVLWQGSGARNIEFSPVNYPNFDGVIVKKCGVDDTGRSLNAAFNRDGPDYSLNAPLHRGVATLRNYLAASMFPDGVYLPQGDSAQVKRDYEQDIANFKKLTKIAEFLGEKLAGEEANENIIQKFTRSVKRLFAGERLSTPDVSAFMQAANVPDTGIKVMYDAIAANPEFNLPPREQTPFSDKSIALASSSASLGKVADAFDLIVPHFTDTETLRAKDKLITVDEARAIIDNLQKKLSEGTGGFETDILDPRQVIARGLLKSTHALRGLMAEISRYSSDRLNDKEFVDAKDAINQISYRVRSGVIKALIDEGKKAEAQKMTNDIDTKTNPPYHITHEKDIPLSQLIDKVDVAIEHAAILEKAIPAELREAKVPLEEKTPSPCTVESLDSETKIISIEEGQKILDALRRKMEDWNNEIKQTDKVHADIPTSYEAHKVEILETLSPAIMAFNESFFNLAATNPAFINNEKILLAADASILLGNEVVDLLHEQGKHEEAKLLKEMMNSRVHPEFKQSKELKNLTDLMAALETGMSEATALQHGLSSSIDNKPIILAQQSQLHSQEEARQETKADTAKIAALESLQGMGFIEPRYDTVAGVSDEKFAHRVSEIIARKQEQEAQLRHEQEQARPKTRAEILEQEKASELAGVAAR